MAILRQALGCAGALFLSGCGAATAPVRPTEESVAVYSVLAAGSDTAAVMLTGFDPEASDADSPFRRVSGANVRIIHGLDTLQFREAPVGFRDCIADEFADGESEPIRPGCYAAVVKGGIRPGERYELRISLTAGREIRGTATVPGVPQILAPAPGRVVPVHIGGEPARGTVTTLFPVRWTAPAGAGRIEIGIVRPRAYRGGRVLAGVRCRLHPGPLPEDLVRIDSVTHQVVTAVCLGGGEIVRWDSITAQLVLTAYDSVYDRYAREVLSKSSVRRNRASAGVEGAFGVFAGAASAERPLTLVPATR